LAAVAAAAAQAQQDDASSGSGGPPTGTGVTSPGASPGGSPLEGSGDSEMPKANRGRRRSSNPLGILMKGKKLGVKFDGAGAPPNPPTKRRSNGMLGLRRFMSKGTVPGVVNKGQRSPEEVGSSRRTEEERDAEERARLRMPRALWRPAEEAKSNATQSAIYAATREYGEEMLRKKWRQQMGDRTVGVEAEISKMFATLSAIEAGKKQQQIRKQELEVQSWHARNKQASAEAYGPPLSV